jgi:hypothetical protein
MQQLTKAKLRQALFDIQSTNSSDGEIAERIGCSRSYVSSMRRIHSYIKEQDWESLIRAAEIGATSSLIPKFVELGLIPESIQPAIGEARRKCVAKRAAKNISDEHVPETTECGGQIVMDEISRQALLCDVYEIKCLLRELLNCWKE